jgi:hypothetical protein
MSVAKSPRDAAAVLHNRLPVAEACDEYSQCQNADASPDSASLSLATRLASVSRRVV